MITLLVECEEGQSVKKDESANMAEDEPIFHIEKPPFSRSQLAKSPRSSYGGMESGDNGIQEKSRFLEKNVADEKADESALLVIPKDR